MTTHDNSNQVAVFGRQLTIDGEVGQLIGVPVSRLHRHTLITGTTGAGKTTTATTAVTTASTHLDGATIVLDPKASDWPKRLARAEYYIRGDLDHVHLFDTSELLPAISFFDIRPMMQSGISRERAVNAIANHFLQIIDHVMTDGLDAVRSPDVLRYLVVALFDPVYGADHYSLETLADTVYELRRNRVLPEVSTDWGETLLKSIQDGSEQMFQSVLQGVVTRLEKIFGSGVLRPIFNHSPDHLDDAFTFSDYLDRDVTLLFDLGSLTASEQRVLATTLTSLLWRSVQQRSVQSAHGAEPPTALLVLEELAELGVADLLTELLPLAREYRLGVIGMLQYPGQLAGKNPDAYREIINNVHSLVVGRIPSDDLLLDRLTSSRMSQGQVRNRLGSLPLDQWLFQPAEHRPDGPIRTHTIKDPPLPPGDPDGPRRLPPEQQARFTDAFEERRAHARRHTTVSYEDYTAPSRPETVQDTGTTALDPETWDMLVETQFQTTLPLVEDQLPETVQFDGARAGLVCRRCGGIQPPTKDGLIDAVRCHGDLTDLDRDDILPVRLDLGLSTDELLAAPLDPIEIIALQLLYNMCAGRYHHLEYDPVFDPQHDLLERFGITQTVRSTLDDAGYLNQDRTKRYVFATPTPEARDLLNEVHRRTLTWGHGEGDLTESALHVSINDGLERYIEHAFVTDPDSPVTTVKKYYELDADTAEQYGLDERIRFDVVGLDDDNRIRVIGEAELDNNDKHVAAIHDFDEIAAVNPDHAIWAVPTDNRGHEAVLKPLADPPDDIDDPTPRIKPYAETTKMAAITGINEPGLTEIHSLTNLRNAIEEPTLYEET